MGRLYPRFHLRRPPLRPRRGPLELARRRRGLRNAPWTASGRSGRSATPTTTTAGRSTRRMATAVANTIGIGVCRGGAWSVNYHHGGIGGVVRPFFDDDQNAAAELAVRRPEAVSFTTNGCTSVWPGSRTPGLSFNPIGSTLARVNNPLDPPARWRIDYLTLTTAGQGRRGRRVRQRGRRLRPDLILYGRLGGRSSPARCRSRRWRRPRPAATCSRRARSTTAAPTANGTPATRVRRKGAWTGGTARSRPRPGFSVRYNSALKQWQVVYTDTRQGGGFPAEITIGTGPTRSAPGRQGPSASSRR